MGSLKDIAAKNPRVDVRGVLVEITGISAAGFATLIARFPECLDLLNGKDVSLSAEMLVKTGPAFVAAVIAAGTGKIADDEEEKAAAGLTTSDQLALLEHILKWTFPDMGEFVARLERASETAGLASTTLSRKLSNTSSPPDTPTPADTRLDGSPPSAN